MKLSIFLPSIRTFYLNQLYESALKSCKRYSFEFVIAGPFDLPEELKGKANVKFIKTYTHPTKAAQLAALECSGELIYHTTDDVLFIEDAIDDAIDLLEGEQCATCDVVSMRYIESLNHEVKGEFPLRYWTVANSCPVPTLNQDWNINVHFLMTKQAFVDYGGFDCCFEYLTQAGADLLIRMQKYGSVVHHSAGNVSTADWSGGSKGAEHHPIQVAQEQFDVPLFWNIWTYQFGSRKFIDLYNCNFYPEKWQRRFGNSNPSSYNEL